MIAAAEHSPLDPAISLSRFLPSTHPPCLRPPPPLLRPLLLSSFVLLLPHEDGAHRFRGKHSSPLTFRASSSQLTGVSFFFAVDRSGTGQSGSSPRVTLRLNQVRGTRDEKKGGGAANSRQGGMSAQVRTYIYIFMTRQQPVAELHSLR